MNRNEGRMGSSEEVFLEDDGVAPAAIVPEETSSTAKFNWSTPTETVVLPSRGVFYPPQHPLHNREEIEIRYMTAKEEDLLTDRALLKNGTAIDRALQNLITDKNIKVNEMLVGDKNAVIVAARITGYGSEYDTKVTCPACAEVDDFSFDLSDVKSNNTFEAVEELGITLTNRSTFIITIIH